MRSRDECSNAEARSSAWTICEYYDVDPKKACLERFVVNEKFRFEKLDIAARKACAVRFARERFDCVPNMAAQAGRRCWLKTRYRGVGNIGTGAD